MNRETTVLVVMGTMIAISFIACIALQAQINQLSEIMLESEIKPFATIPLLNVTNIFGEPVQGCHEPGKVNIIVFHSITSKESLKQRVILEEIKEDFGETIQIAYASAPRYNVTLDSNKNRNTKEYFDLDFNQSQQLIEKYKAIFYNYKYARYSNEHTVTGIPLLLFDCKQYRSKTLIPAEENGYARIHSEKIDIKKQICSMLETRPSVCNKLIEAK